MLVSITVAMVTGAIFFLPKIIKNVMKDHLFCIIVSSRVEIVGLWRFLLALTTVQWECLRGQIKHFISP